MDAMATHIPSDSLKLWLSPSELTASFNFGIFPLVFYEEMQTARILEFLNDRKKVQQALGLGWHPPANDNQVQRDFDVLSICIHNRN